MSKGKYNRTDFATKFKAAEALKELLINEGKPDEEGYVYYKPGHSDQTLADELDIPAQTIRNIRAEVYGNLTRGSVGRDVSKEVNARVDALFQRLERLERAVGDEGQKMRQIAKNLQVTMGQLESMERELLSRLRPVEKRVVQVQGRVSQLEDAVTKPGHQKTNGTQTVTT